MSGILDADSDALVLVAGDLNDFQFGEPGEGADTVTIHNSQIVSNTSGTLFALRGHNWW